MNTFITKDCVYSKHDIEKKINKITGFFKYNKINDKIIIIKENKEEIVFLYLACLKNKITFIPLDINVSYDYIESIKKVSGTNIVITDKDNIFGEEADTNTFIQDSDIACILFSSGSTNQPKAIQLTYGNIRTQMNSFKREYKLTNASIISNLLPLHYADGIFQGPLMAYYNNCSFFLNDTFKVQNMISLLKSFKLNKITHLILSPVLLKIIELLEEYTLPYFHDNNMLIISTSDKINITLWNNLVNKFNLKIISVYGLTETVAGVFFTKPGNKEIGSIGKKPIDCNIKIVDNELWIKSKHISPGYLNNEKENKNTFKNGWLKTGDLAYKNNGLYYIIGRKKNVIISSGYAIYPEEVNEILKNNQQILDSAVFGEEDLEKGEIISAAIVSNLTQEEIIRYLDKYLVKYKQPKNFYFIDKIEKTITGKINYVKLKENLKKWKIE